MTSPITDSDFEAFMPYGATYSPIAGSSTMKTNSTNQHVDGHNLALEPGPVSVSATWTGEEQCDLYLSRTGAELLRLSSIERKAGGGCAPRQQSNSEPSKATESISTSAEAGQEPANPPVQSPSSQPCLSAPGGGLGGRYDDDACRPARVRRLPDRQMGVSARRERRLRGPRCGKFPGSGFLVWHRPNSASASTRRRVHGDSSRITESRYNWATNNAREPGFREQWQQVLSANVGCYRRRFEAARFRHGDRPGAASHLFDRRADVAAMGVAA